MPVSVPGHVSVANGATSLGWCFCFVGLRVSKHCTANSSTTCVPCVGKTYTDHPNGLEYCKSCKLCDKGKEDAKKTV